MNKEEIIKKLSLYDKASLLVGYTNMTTRPIEELGIPSFVMSDGPNGVRKEASDKDGLEGTIKTLPATCFPCGSALAQSFDEELFYEVGKQIALECRYYKVNAILGPAINIKRNPLCGRNFEYLSEDPYLAGRLATSYVKGVQSEKVLACLKHYACNNLEKWRYVGNSVVDERALNEIYLKPFEIVVKEANPGMVMTAYNQTNGKFASENKYLVKDTLIDNWGYQGLTVTDWGGMVHRDISLNMGQDLEMPGMLEENIQKIVDGVNSGKIEIETLDNSVVHLLDAIEKTRTNDSVDDSVFAKSSEIALKAAIKSAVLLKNDNKALPLDKNVKLAVVGDMFDQMHYQGGGSALINAREVIDNKKAFDEEGIEYVFARGYDQNKRTVNRQLESAAIKVCKDSNIILYFGGLTDLSESEGYDRPNMKLDKNQIHLIEELAKLNKQLICVFYGGSPFEIPCFEKIDGILFMNLPGQMGGLAVTELLFGRSVPTGRLAFTWPLKYEDVPFSDEFAKTPIELYKESIYVGYRYYSTVNQVVRFPFGYGLSYNRPFYSNFEVKKNKDKVTVSFDAENQEESLAEDVVQIYVGAPHSSIPRPKKELKKFIKVKLVGLEKKRISADIPFEDLEVFDRNLHGFALENGDYFIYISKNAEIDYYKELIEIKGLYLSSHEKDRIYWDINHITDITTEQFGKFIGKKLYPYIPSRRPYTLETPICEYRTITGALIKHEMKKVGQKIIDSAKKVSDEQEKQRRIKSGTFMKQLVLQNCMRSLLYSSGGILNYKKAEGIIDLANLKIISGIKKLK